MQIMQRRGVAWRTEERRYWNDEFVVTSRPQTQERCGTTETGGQQQEVYFCSCRQSAVNRRVAAEIEAVRRRRSSPSNHHTSHHVDAGA